ncbi:dienelactone hydrolase family protein [Fluviicola sp.]|uniref:alpha/beta hydrolase n=1 Tax=Fluviicola sp. TaxID=1917219 RepID=UPI0031E476C7
MKNIQLLLALLLLISGISSCNAQPDTSGTNKQTPKEEQVSNLLFYKIHEARGTEAPVLVVLLHGYGSNEDDLLSLAQFFPENYIVASLQAPYPIGAASFQWYDIQNTQNQQAEVTESSKKVVATVKELQKKYGVSASKTFIGGFSQGGIMSYQLGLSDASLAKGILVLSGRLLPMTREATAGKKASELAIFIAHGDSDKRISFNEANDAKQWLEQHQYSIDFHIYKGMGHAISQEEMKDVLEFVQKND